MPLLNCLLHPTFFTQPSLPYHSAKSSFAQSYLPFLLCAPSPPCLLCPTFSALPSLLNLLLTYRLCPSFSDLYSLPNIYLTYIICLTFSVLPSVSHPTLPPVSALFPTFLALLYLPSLGKLLFLLPFVCPFSPFCVSPFSSTLRLAPTSRLIVHSSYDLQQQL